MTGSNWSVADADDIQKNGHAGYERVAVKYGLISQTEEEAHLEDQRAKLSRFADALAKLITGDRLPNRTFVHELLSSTTLRHPIVEKTAKVVELVTQGMLDWKDFGHIMNAELRELALD